MSESEHHSDISVTQVQQSNQTPLTTENSPASQLTPPTPSGTDDFQRETSLRNKTDKPPSEQSFATGLSQDQSVPSRENEFTATASASNDAKVEETKTKQSEESNTANDTSANSNSKEDHAEQLSTLTNADESEPLTVKLPDCLEASSGEGSSAELLDVVIPPPKTCFEAGACASSEPSRSSNGTSNASQESTESVYHIKWINFKNKQVPIVTQNENGPCPLLAIMNVLFLQNRIKLPPQSEFISASQLMAHLGECVFENVPNPEEGLATPTRLNFEQNMGDAMAVMHKLQTGLDVNVRFTGVREFEYTSECIIFDLLQIALYHGWLVDPQNVQEVQAIGQCTYNQLVEKIIGDKSSNKSEVVSQALIAEQFLESSASQLTYHGLSELVSQLKEDELAVLFRNNHFTTLYRNKNELFQLVTDQGFLTENNVVWETLSNVEGDCHFVDSEFRTYTKPELPPVETPTVPVNTEEQIDQDYLVALSLQQEQQSAPAWSPPGDTQQLSDLELARSLQEEERRAAIEQASQDDRRMQQYGSRPSPSHSLPRNRNQRPENREREEKKSDCCIL